MYDDYRDRGFVPVCLPIQQQLATVKYYAQQYTYPFWMDAGGAWSMYRINGYIPLNYVIDTTMTVVNGSEGFSEYTVRSWIESALPPLGTEEQHELGVARIAEVFPNPATGPATMHLSIPKSGTIRLRAFGSDGSLVREVYSGHVDAGEGHARWDLADEYGEQVANGTYFLELTGDAGSARSRVTVLR